MDNAITFVFYIFNSFVDFIFNKFQITTGVYFGWVCLAILVFIMIIKSVLNLPSSTSFKHETITRKNGTKVTIRR